MKHSLLIAAVVATLAVGCSFGDFTEYWATAAEGRILEAGHPVAGAQIRREVWDHHGEGEKKVQLATSDQNGLVFLPDLTKSSHVKTIGTEVYLQKYTILVQGKERLVWEGQKIDNIRFTELAHEKKFFLKVDDQLTFTIDITSLK